MAPHTRRDDSARIPCPRCRSNNFLGQTHCWQCRSPLPPPEAVAGYAPPQPRPASNAWNTAVPQRRSRNPLPLLFVSLLLVCGVLMVSIAFRAKYPETTRPDGRPLDREKRAVGVDPEAPEKVWDVGPISEPSSASEYDPVAAEARRAVERASRELDLPPPGAARDSEGRIRLRGGGSVSAEEWERARRKVQESPYLREPPMPPPF